MTKYPICIVLGLIAYMVNFLWTKPWTIYTICSVIILLAVGIMKYGADWLTNPSNCTQFESKKVPGKIKSTQPPAISDTNNLDGGIRYFLSIHRKPMPESKVD